MMRVVLDTNVLVSLLLDHTRANSPVNAIYQAIKANQIVLLTSKPILRETESVLAREHIAVKYRLTPQNRTAYLAHIQQISHLVKTKMTLSAVAADPDDDKVLACAMKGKASYVISGDQHLLKLRHFHQIKIATPREFLSVLTAKAEEHIG